MTYKFEASPDKTKPAATGKLPETACFFYGRGDKIRTCGPYVPNVVLYQTEPHLDATHIVYHDFGNLSSIFCKTKFSKVFRSYFAENIVKKSDNITILPEILLIEKVQKIQKCIQKRHAPRFCKACRLIRKIDFKG